jgi:hypothetical protein
MLLLLNTETYVLTHSSLEIKTMNAQPMSGYNLTHASYLQCEKSITHYSLNVYVGTYVHGILPGIGTFFFGLKCQYLIQYILSKNYNINF